MADERHPFHSLCSYLGCFPPQVPRRVIEELAPRNGIVLDPFCGSGTTLVEALNMKRRAIGIDLNPLAVALSQAKIQSVSLSNVIDRIDELALGYRVRSDVDLAPDKVKIIFHPRTLAQLLYLREAFDYTRPEDVFLRGALLGIMHGKFRKGGDSAYLSIDMPNTFSMSPEYVRRFVATHSLRQPPADVFSKLRERATHLLRRGALQGAGKGIAIQGDATRLEDLLATVKVTTVHAIITSPPYLGVLRYGAFNWIRLWFLGHEPALIDKTLDSTDSLDRYLSFMANFLRAASKVLAPGAPMALVIGDVHEFDVELQLAKRVWEELAGLVPFEMVRIDADKFDSTGKTTRIWGEERKGRATPLDRVLILRRKGRHRRSSGRVAA
jgi:site-specific DNA-methyltransferase (adenine-specific)